MNHKPLVVLAALLLAAGLWASIDACAPPKPAPPPNNPAPPAPVPSPPAPAPQPGPCPGPGPCPAPRPRGPRERAPVGAPHEGGPSSDGVEVACDLPPSLRAKNVGGRDGAGLCVFTSLMHSARYQNESRLWDFQRQMRSEPGGGYPSKVDRMIQKYGPGTQYLQYEGPDPAVLDAAIASGRMPAVTYDGHDCHYRGSVAHMVNLVYLDASRACILDNNFVGDGELVWMTREEFLARWRGRDTGWAVVLLNPAPPPPPHN